MENARVGSEKNAEIAQSRRVAGIQVRSGVKAGRFNPELGGPRDIGPERPGAFGPRGRL